MKRVFAKRHSSHSRFRESDSSDRLNWSYNTLSRLEIMKKQLTKRLYLIKYNYQLDITDKILSHRLGGHTMSIYDYSVPTPKNGDFSLKEYEGKV
ncbi:MAG: hypothetical protein IKF10_00815, partial [Lachnospiraceae bacterium]|nr:hypothetical protein [Lachnospiraceae bacterium]